LCTIVGREPEDAILREARSPGKRRDVVRR